MAQHEANYLIELPHLSRELELTGGVRKVDRLKPRDDFGFHRETKLLFWSHLSAYNGSLVKLRGANAEWRYTSHLRAVSVSTAC